MVGNNIFGDFDSTEDLNNNRDRYGRENGPKVVVYSKNKQTINNNLVYTISNENEKCPEIDDLFKVKVKVPKVKISKYFEDKYSPCGKSNVLKIGESKFLSSIKDKNSDYRNKFGKIVKFSSLNSPGLSSSIKYDPFGVVQSSGIRSRVSDIIMEMPKCKPTFGSLSSSMANTDFQNSSLSQHGSTQKLAGTNFKYFNSKRGKHRLPTIGTSKNKLNPNMSSFSHREFLLEGKRSENKQAKLFEKMSKIQNSIFLL